MGQWFAKFFRPSGPNITLEQLERLQEAQKHAEELSKVAAELTEEMRGIQKRATEAQENVLHHRAAAEEAARRAQEALDEQLRRMAEAETAVREAQEEARKARAEKEEVERLWKEGVPPALRPSLEEIQAKKKEVHYDAALFHFAVAGVAGSGKSSLINAFRGLRNQQPGAAPTGVVETTVAVTRYPPADPDHPLVWFDLPGAGTLNVSGWQYFNKQGLYVFDAIIVLFDSCFTATDVALIENSKQYGIPAFIVRSKADQHVRNIAIKDFQYDSDEEDPKSASRKKIFRAAQTMFIDETRRSVKANLEKAKLPNQKVYIISSDTMFRIAKNKKPKNIIDELDLLKDLYVEAHRTRGSEALAGSIEGMTGWMRSLGRETTNTLPSPISSSLTLSPVGDSADWVPVE